MVFVKAPEPSGRTALIAGAGGGGTPMRSGTKIIRVCALLAAFMALSAMAGCPKSSDFQSSNRQADGPPDHAGPGAGGMGHAMGGGMGMP
jgi:hypothetical protein